MTEEYLADLNSNQLKAAQTLYGPVLIQAGAGSGKTKTVIARIVNMIHHGISPANILAITFTNKAANELKDRIKDTNIKNAEMVTACTIHHFCLTILMKYHYPDIFFPNQMHTSKPVILADDSDKKRIIRNIRSDFLTIYAPQHNIDSYTKKDIESFPISKLVNYISNYKKWYVLTKKFGLKSKNFEIKAEDLPFQTYIQYILTRYIYYASSENAIDFDDMLFNALNLLQTNPFVRQELQKHYQYISVDEYQDTSQVQELIIRLLADTKEQNLCVVGDPNQSIYAFRGANINNILSFSKQYPRAEVITLDTNYRSQPDILSLANDVIQNNPNPYKSKISLKPSHDTHNQLPQVIITDNQYKQAEQIGKIILKKKQERNLKFTDFAVLFRNNFSGVPIQTIFTQMGIPFDVHKNDNIYERIPVKDLMAYLNLFVDHTHDLDLLRIINTPSRGIGLTTVKLLRDARANMPNHSIFEIMEHLPELNINGKTVNSRTIKATSDFVQKVNKIKPLSNMTLTDALKYVMNDLGYGAYLENDDNQNNNEFAGELVLLANRFDLDHPNMTLMERVVEFTNMIKLNETADSKDDPKGVHLSTIHSAKGLEYDTVFVVDAVQDVLPAKYALNSYSRYLRANDPTKKSWLNPLHEERRLMYVAITRAKNELYIMYPKLMNTYYGQVSTEPSMFITQMDEHKYEVKDLDSSKTDEE